MPLPPSVFRFPPARRQHLSVARMRVYPLPQSTGCVRSDLWRQSPYQSTARRPGPTADNERNVERKGGRQTQLLIVYHLLRARHGDAREPARAAAPEVEATVGEPRDALPVR